MIVDEKIIRIAELTGLTGLSKTTIWRLERNGDFPKKRWLSSNAVGWLKSEVIEWLKNRPLVA